MSADPNEFLRFILAQQQRQQQEQQRQGGDAQSSTNQQLTQVYQQLEALAPARNDAAQQQPPPHDALSRLVANYLQGVAGGGTNAAAPASNHGMNFLSQALAAQGIGHNYSMTSVSNNDTPSVSDSASMHEQLISAAKVLAAANPGLAAAAVDQVMAMNPLQQHPQAHSQQQMFQTSNTLVPSRNNVEKTISAHKSFVDNSRDQDAPNNAMKTNYTQNVNVLSFKSNAHNYDQQDAVVFMSGQLPVQSRSNSRVATSSTEDVNGSVGTNRNPSSTVASSSVALLAEPVSVLTLQTWNIEQLESHVRRLQESNQPIPNTVRIILEDARNKEARKNAKRMANRKSASTSRARKKQLIDELTAAHAKLRRHALILAYLPDPVVVIGVSGKIKFCSAQIERMLNYKSDGLVGSSIEDIIVPDSRRVIRQLIHDLVDAEQRALSALNEGWQQHQGNGASSDENGERNYGGSRDDSNDVNTVSRSSDQSFPLLEVNFDGAGEVGSGENVSNSSDGPTSKKNHKADDKNKSEATMSSSTKNSSSLTAETSTSDDKKRPAKIAKTKFEREKAMAEESGPIISDCRKKNAKTDNSKSQTTMSSLTHNSSSLTAESSTSEDQERVTKKADCNLESMRASAEESASSSELKPSHTNSLDGPTSKKMHKTTNNKSQATLSSLTHNSSSLTAESSTSEDLEPPDKKAKSNFKDKMANSEEFASSSELKPSDANSLDDPTSEKKHKATNSKSQATMSSLTHNSSSLTAESSTSEDQERPVKKMKPNIAREKADLKQSLSSGERKPSDPNPLAGTTSKMKQNNTNNKSLATMFSLANKNSSSQTTESKSSKDDEHAAKKTKTDIGSDKANSEESASSNELKLSGTFAINFDDVMGSSVTANNAGAKLSSLIHYSGNETKEGNVTMKLSPKVTHQKPCLNPKQDAYSRTTSKSSEKQEDSPSLSAESSTPVPGTRLNSSEDSGYRDSNESSDSSSISGNSIPQKKKGKKHRRPLAPSCNVSLVRSDLTTIWCELTSSIRTRTRNDEDIELGIIDLNPKATTDTQTEESHEEEKELLLCFRPIIEGGKIAGGKMGEELCLPQQKSKVDHKSSHQDEETPSSGTETDCAKCSPTKKRNFARGQATLVTGEPLEKKNKSTHDFPKANINAQQEEERVV
eukprot:CCRYP_019435-RA/>CCRYP_019435-RA protein AED:0.01 eAED:0.01 QI:134/1/1/1/0.8/0.66/6/142/1158